MKLKLFILVALFFHFINAQLKSELNFEEKEYISKFVYPLKTYNPEEKDNSDLLILDKLIGNSKVVGLGESTHGSSEIYKLKYRISEYLIANKNFNIFTLEANMPESFKMNRYIIEQKDDPKNILKGMYFWLWQTEETLNFIEWLKNYNKKHNPQVYFDGFDMQYAKGAVEQIREFYKDNHLSEQEINTLEIGIKKYNRGLKSYNKKGKKIINEYLDEIAKKSTLTNNLEEESRFLQNINIIRQYVQQTYIKRDKFMAENIKWLTNKNPNSKLIVSAHNYHIAKLNPERMGYWINQDSVNNYINFGFAFYEGSYSASINRKIGTYNSEMAFPGTLEYKLNSLNIPIFILDLKSIKNENNKLGKWIIEDVLFRKTGSGTDKNEFKKTNIANSFDYLIFINKSTNSKLLNDYSK